MRGVESEPVQARHDQVLTSRNDNVGRPRTSLIELILIGGPSGGDQDLLPVLVPHHNTLSAALLSLKFLVELAPLALVA